MTDLCTLVPMVFLNAIACVPAQYCEPPKDGRILCRPDPTGHCEPAVPQAVQYECKRADGTTYIFSKPREK